MKVHVIIKHVQIINLCLLIQTLVIIGIINVHILVVNMIVNIEHVLIIQVQLMKPIVEVGYHIVHQIMLLHNV